MPLDASTVRDGYIPAISSIFDDGLREPLAHTLRVFGNLK